MILKKANDQLAIEKRNKSIFDFTGAAGRETSKKYRD